MARFHWPHYAGQTFTLKATHEQSADWTGAARQAGFPHTSKWIAEAADFYATFQKQRRLKEKRREEREKKEIAERVRRVQAGEEP
jgi:hypothetical protein